MNVGAENHLPVITVVDATDEIVAIDLEGEFDLNETADLTEAAKRALGRGKHLIVNLSETTFIDSSVIRALFNIDRLAKSHQRMLALQLATAPSVERVLAITHASEQLTIAPTRAEAIELIRGRQRRTA